MDRVTVMADRLPPVYRIEPGSRLHQVLDLAGLHLATVDEDMDRIQRSHWVDSAFDRDDLAKLGDLFDIGPAPWEPSRLYRERLKATIAARLSGSVTRRDLDGVLARILDAARAATGTRYAEISPPAPGAPLAFAVDPGENRPAFVEFPLRRRRSDELRGPGAVIVPLDRRTVVNRGIADTMLELVLRGMPGGRAAVPMVANLTSGSVVGFAGVVRAGSELLLRAEPDGTLRADLDGGDVTADVYTSQQFLAGERFEPLLPDPEPRAIVLRRGDNRLWFLSLALYDSPGLDAGAFATAASELRQGVFSSSTDVAPVSRYDASLFHQPPSAVVDAWWDERAPASFRFDLPAGAVLREAGRRDEPELDRDRLFQLLQSTVDRLRAAAVVGEVAAVPLRESQPARDRCAVVAPADTTDVASAGEDHLAALGALFDLTAADGARLG